MDFVSKTPCVATADTYLLTCFDANKAAVLMLWLISAIKHIGSSRISFTAQGELRQS